MRAISLACLLGLLLSACGSGPQLGKYQSECLGLFDTVIVMVGYAQSEEEFQSWAEAAYDRLEELDRLFDIYNAYEGVNNLHTVNQNAGIAPVEVEREIIDLLLFAREGYALTDGAVNVAMGSVLAIWHDYRERGVRDAARAELPPLDMLRGAALLADMDGLVIDEVNSTVFLKRPGMSLDVGAVAKGYAAGLAARAACERGAHSMLLNVGGNITAIGAPADQTRAAWDIGIRQPELPVSGNERAADTVYVNDATVSCSGDYQRFYTVGGENYHHIIDPETLMPASLYRQVAVVHADAGIADLLSTALFLLKQEEGAALAESVGAEALWMYRDGSQKATEGYAALAERMGR